jgi:hypothetical protein
MKIQFPKTLSYIHPFLFAIFPVLFLFAYNIDEVPATDLILPLFATIIGTLIVFLLLRLITKNSNKAAIVTSILLILFFSYGHVRDALSSLGINGLDIGQLHISPQFILAPLWLALFIVGAFLVIRAHRDFSTSTKFLNVVAIALVVISLINISIYEITTLNRAPEEANKGGTTLSSGNPNNLPDIYYIILDGYARQDALEEVYGFDNSEFIQYLTNKGFYVASQSRSNYSSTTLSMPSSLNMDYLTADELASAKTRFEMIGNNKVSQLLKEKGYRYIFVGGGIDWKGIANYTDGHFVYRSGSLFKKSDFIDSLAHTTALSPFLIFFQGFFGDNDRKARLYAFDKLADIPDIKEPTFVYAHIVSPHPPFIFDRNGNPPKQSIFVGTGNIWVATGHEDRYVDQLIFVNKKVETLIDEILSKPGVPPIIILQGDHGMWWEKGKETDILNAYYLPGKDNQLLYDSISPVNSFRIVFNLYLDTDYQLLKDETP